MKGLQRHRVRYVIVGGEAVIFHGYPRLTGDIDFFYENSAVNTRRLFAALNDFWSGRVPGVRSPEELREEKLVVQFGRPPNRIDLLNRIDGVTFTEAWRHRIAVRVIQSTTRPKARRQEAGNSMVIAERIRVPVLGAFLRSCSRRDTLAPLLAFVLSLQISAADDLTQREVSTSEVLTCE